jgi:hypothetical protein
MVPGLLLSTGLLLDSLGTAFYLERLLLPGYRAILADRSTNC